MMNATNPIETLSKSMAHAAYEAFPEYAYKDRDWEKYNEWRNKLNKEQLKTANFAPADCYIEKSRKHSLDDLTVATMFPQTWSSTALGFGGIGGQAFTSAYVCVIESNLIGQFAVYFGGSLAYVIENPNNVFFAHIAEKKMVDSKDGKKTYER